MKTAIQVTAAVLLRGDSILIARRGEGSHLEGFWEFPGGKIREGESPERCLERELWEELQIRTRTGDFLCYSAFDYGSKTVNLHVFRSKMRGGSIRLTAHSEICWVRPDELHAFTFAPADVKIVRHLLSGCQVSDVETPSDYQTLRGLFVAYARSLPFALSFQGFETEIRELDRHYVAPDGGAFLLRDAEGEPIGCAAVRRLEAGACELKRMYIKPEGRGLGSGSVLLDRCFHLARRLGYRTMRLDTISSMTDAIRLYEKAGFYEISAYRHNPEAGVRYFECALC